MGEGSWRRGMNIRGLERSGSCLYHPWSFCSVGLDYSSEEHWEISNLTSLRSSVVLYKKIVVVLLPHLYWDCRCAQVSLPAVFSVGCEKRGRWLVAVSGTSLILIDVFDCKQCIKPSWPTVELVVVSVDANIFLHAVCVLVVRFMFSLVSVYHYAKVVPVISNALCW